MEAFAIWGFTFGLVAFVLVLQLRKEVKSLKEKIKK